MTKKKEEKVIEKHLVISLRKALSKPRTGRANKAVGEIKARISQHFRVKAENVRISNALNAFVWQHGIEHIPRKVSVKGLTRDKFVDVFLESEKIKIR